MTDPINLKVKKRRISELSITQVAQNCWLLYSKEKIMY
jgi:hypothetical protein